ncbi:MAG: thiamine pyrophosphate-dependent enzyme [SAR202 cluster bacterium]|nr:thiamine pyrophosphate-dependent enzyme [SAR202 cluster bacterium]HJO60163.1 thiamine pyrophosphate-dependent enzyme [SAR202 cluster bacterium]
MISAIEAVKAISDIRSSEVVVATMTANRYWESVSQNQEMDLPIFGAMGKASSVALGLALSQPNKKIVVLDGDGSLLMNLGSLVTVAGMEPKNFLHFVFEDGAYWTTGGQPIPGNGKFNLSAMANDAGYKSSHSFEDLETLVSELPSLMRQDGPIFVSIKITHPEHAGEPFIGSTKNAMEKLSKSISGY